MHYSLLPIACIVAMAWPSALFAAPGNPAQGVPNAPAPGFTETGSAYSSLETTEPESEAVQETDAPPGADESGAVDTNANDQNRAGGETRELEADEALPPGALTPLDTYTGRNGIGAYVGLGSGIGLSYRRYVVDRFALRATGYVVHIDDTMTLYSASFTAQYDFRRDERFALYAVGGLANSVSRFEKDDGTTETVGIFPAIGVGIELGEHEKVGFTYQFEMALTGIFIDGAYRKLLPLPQVGIYYVF